MIIRQMTLNNDLAILFKHKTHAYHTSQFILYRCLIDDFIHINFIVNQDNSDEMLINFNADAISKNFNKIKELAELNEQKLGGNYPYYPTYALLEEVKEKMKNSPFRQHHFSDKESFKFKTFKSTGNLIRDLEDLDYTHQLKRAYFIWRKYSDFVHYSNFAFDEEEMIDPEKDHTYTEFVEIIGYSYFTLIDCFEHFQEKYNIAIIDSTNLKDYFKDAKHK